MPGIQIVSLPMTILACKNARHNTDDQDKAQEERERVGLQYAMWVLHQAYLYDTKDVHGSLAATAQAKNILWWKVPSHMSFS